MAGHSKFANIKHKKEKEDSKRGKAFAQLGKEITVAAKLGGKDINFNPRLRLAIDRAKSMNMPKDNIEKAIKKGAGELSGNSIFEIRYEGYAPGGVAVIVDAVTDNKNRTASDVRHSFNKYGGNMEGTVSWNFNKKGVIILDSSSISEEELMERASDLGAEDYSLIGDKYFIFTSPDSFYSISEGFIEAEDKYLSMIPNIYKEVDDETLEKINKMLDHMNNIDDVKEVYTNLKLQ